MLSRFWPLWRLQQYQIIRNEGEKLVDVVKNQELLNAADRNLAKVSPRPKSGSCNVYLRKGVCPQCKKSTKSYQVFICI